ncbi:unnamed protein product [Clonostachys rhizophaga]|uniref:Uncharacterized protein n=1 Tax=Clonostachys rhizophaga TaxID=160324 RepID=A0A9N9YS73_9HYPO|nr:unnamed protein product [Clonostachys rhizophaga]
MVAITRTAAAGIAVLSALKGAAASTETRDVFDDVAVLDARDVLNEGAEPLALDARDFDDELSYETRDFDDELYYETRDYDDHLEKRLFGLLKVGRKVLGGVAKAAFGRKGRRSLDDSEDFLEGRGIEEDVVAFDTRDLGDDVPLEARAILDGSHPDLVVVNKRIFRGIVKGFGRLIGGRSIDDEDLDVRDFDDYEVSFEARDEEESTSEGPSGDAPSPSRKGKKLKGKKLKGKKLKGTFGKGKSGKGKSGKGKSGKNKKTGPKKHGKNSAKSS